jgi:hypothetical protein
MVIQNVPLLTLSAISGSTLPYPRMKDYLISAPGICYLRLKIFFILFQIGCLLKAKVTNYHVGTSVAWSLGRLENCLRHQVEGMLGELLHGVKGKEEIMESGLYFCFSAYPSLYPPFTLY